MFRPALSFRATGRRRTGNPPRPSPQNSSVPSASAENCSGRKLAAVATKEEQQRKSSLCLFLILAGSQYYIHSVRHRRACIYLCLNLSASKLAIRRSAASPRQTRTTQSTISPVSQSESSTHFVRLGKPFATTHDSSGPRMEFCPDGPTARKQLRTKRTLATDDLSNCRSSFRNTFTGPKIARCATSANCGGFRSSVAPEGRPKLAVRAPNDSFNLI
jgi:hypothetical protein